MSQNMHGFNHTMMWFLVPVSIVSARNALAQWPPFRILNKMKNALQIISLTAYASETKKQTPKLRATTPFNCLVLDTPA